MEKRALLVIPARGGSKRLPRKNIMPLAGKPLIAHSIEAGLAANVFDRILVTSDDPEILAVADQYSDITIEQRDTSLASDQCKVIDVMLDICQRSEPYNDFNVISMFLPTAPFRRVELIKKGMKLLTPDVDSVISITPFEFPPSMAITIGPDAEVNPAQQNSPLITGNTRSQDQTPAFRPNGSFFFSWRNSLTKLRSFYKGEIRGVVMNRFGSTDIDAEDDLALAEALVNSGLAESDFV